MEDLIGKGLAAEKETVIQIKVYGNNDGILTGLDYKIRSNVEGIDDFLRSIKNGIVGITATEVLEEITAENILENFELLNDDVYVARVIESAIQKAIADYLQKQLNIPVEPNYEE